METQINNDSIRQFWNQFSENWVEFNDWTRSLMMNLVILCKAKNYKNIIDAGCGPGISTRFIEYEMKKDSNLYCFDYSEEMVKMAVNNFKNDIEFNSNKDNYTSGTQFNSENILNIEKDNLEIRTNFKGKIVKIFHSDVEKLYIEDEQFDLYLSNLTAQITSNAERMLREAYRVLKPNGRIGFSIWGKKEISNHFDCFEEIIGKRGIVTPQKRTNYTLSEDMEKLVKLMYDIGFKTIKYEFHPLIINIYSLEEFKKFIFGQPKNLKLMKEVSQELAQNIENDVEVYYHEMIEKSNKFISLHTCIIKADK